MLRKTNPSLRVRGNPLLSSARGSMLFDTRGNAGRAGFFLLPRSGQRLLNGPNPRTRDSKILRHLFGRDDIVVDYRRLTHV